MGGRGSSSGASGHSDGAIKKQITHRILNSIAYDLRKEREFAATKENVNKKFGTNITHYVTPQDLLSSAINRASPNKKYDRETAKQANDIIDNAPFSKNMFTGYHVDVTTKDIDRVMNYLDKRGLKPDKKLAKSYEASHKKIINRVMNKSK